MIYLEWAGAIAYTLIFLAVVWYATFLCTYNRKALVAAAPNSLVELRAKQHDQMVKLRKAQSRHREMIINTFAPDEAVSETKKLNEKLKNERQELANGQKKEIDSFSTQTIPPLWRMVLPYGFGAILWFITVPLAFAKHMGEKAYAAKAEQDFDAELVDDLQDFKVWKAERDGRVTDPLLDLSDEISALPSYPQPLAIENPPPDLTPAASLASGSMPEPLKKEPTPLKRKDGVDYTVEKFNSDVGYMYRAYAKAGGLTIPVGYHTSKKEAEEAIQEYHKQLKKKEEYNASVGSPERDESDWKREREAALANLSSRFAHA